MVNGCYRYKWFYHNTYGITLKLRTIDGIANGVYGPRFGVMLFYCYHPKVALMEYTHHVMNWESFPNLPAEGVVIPRYSTED